MLTSVLARTLAYNPPTLTALLAVELSISVDFKLIPGLIFPNPEIIGSGANSVSALTIATRFPPTY